jgi:hypothetical protein
LSGVAGGVVSQAPIRRSAGILADAMTMCPGTVAAQSCDRARAWWPAHAAWASVPGVWRSSRSGQHAGGQAAVLVCGFVVPGVPADCASASRWQARVRGLRAIVMVAIFFPRRLAMAA